jgi:hypothetical protein
MLNAFMTFTGLFTQGSEVIEGSEGETRGKKDYIGCQRACQPLPNIAIVLR